MSKKSKAAIKVLTEDLSRLYEAVATLRVKFQDLDDTVAFYGSSINNLEMDVKKLSYDFHEEQYTDPQIFKVSKEAYDHLEAELNKPPKKNSKLDRLFNANKDNYSEKIDLIILEKKVREAIVAKLEKSQNANSCTCGDICQAFDSGFQEAIRIVKDM